MTVPDGGPFTLVSPKGGVSQFRPSLLARDLGVGPRVVGTSDWGDGEGRYPQSGGVYDVGRRDVRPVHVCVWTCV